MEHLPLLLVLAIPVLWFFVLGATPSQKRVVTGYVSLGFALLELTAVIWCAALGQPRPFEYEWLSLSSPVLKLSFMIGPVDAGLLILFLISGILYRVSMNEERRPGLWAVDAGLVLSTVIAVSSQTPTGWFAGAFLAGVCGFFMISSQDKTDSAASRAAFRWFSMVMIGAMLFWVAILGAIVHANVSTSAELSMKAASLPEWVRVCAILGLLMLSSQVLFLSGFHSVGAAGPSGILMHSTIALISSVLVIRMPGTFQDHGAFASLALIPAAGAVAAGLRALAERTPTKLQTLVAIQWMSTISISALCGSPESALIAGASCITFFPLLSLIAHGDGRDGKGLVWATLALGCGLPLSAQGWAKLTEIQGLLAGGSAPDEIRWIVFGLKILADLLILIALATWAFDRLREKEQRSKKEPPKKQRYAEWLMVALATTLAYGAPVFGGLFGAQEFSWTTPIEWFSNPLELASKFGELNPLTIVVALSSPVLAVLVAKFWLSKDDESSEKIRTSTLTFVDKIGLNQAEDMFMWSRAFRPLTVLLSISVRVLEEKVFTQGWQWVAGLREKLRKASLAVEDRFLDRTVVNGFAEITKSVGDAVRMMHTGSVQFYFGTGAVLIALVAIRIWMRAGG